MKIKGYTLEELAKIAKKQAKNKKYLGYFQTFNVGDMAHNISFFNRAAGSANLEASNTTEGPAEGMSESLEKISEKDGETPMNEDIKKEEETLHYPYLEITVTTREGNPMGYFDSNFGNWLPDDDETEDITIDYDYEVSKEDILDFLYEIATDENTESMSDEEYEKYLEENYEELLKANYTKVLDHFEDKARKEAQEEYSFQYESLDPTLPISLKEVEDYELEEKDPLELTEEEKKFVRQEESTRGFAYESLDDDSWQIGLELDADNGQTYKVTEVIEEREVDGYDLCVVRAVKEEATQDDEDAYFVLLDADIEWGPVDTEKEALEWISDVHDGYYSDTYDDSWEDEEDDDYYSWQDDYNESTSHVTASKLEEGRIKELAIEAEEAGGKEKLRKRILKDIHALEASLEFLRYQAPKEVKAGGAFESQEEINKAIENTQKQLEKERAKYKILGE